MSFRIQDTVNLTAEKGDLAASIREANLSTPQIEKYYTQATASGATAYTATLLDKNIIVTGSDTGTLILNLPAPLNNAGLKYNILNASAATVTLTPASSGTITAVYTGAGFGTTGLLTRTGCSIVSNGVSTYYRYGNNPSF